MPIVVNNDRVYKIASWMFYILGYRRMKIYIQLVIARFFFEVGNSKIYDVYFCIHNI
jgi:hypothetical protein